MLRRALALAAVFVMGAPATPAQAADDAVVRKAMTDEMARSLTELKVGASAPTYYLRYTMVDGDHARVSARLGALVEDNRHGGRSARVDARVGSPDEDNQNFRESGGGRTGGVSEEDDYAALRRDLWTLTDQEYKHAVEMLAKKKASHAMQSAEKDKVPDFAAATSVQSVTDHAVPLTDEGRARLKAIVLAVSHVFRDFPTVNGSHVEGGIDVVRRRVLTSEKSWTDERRSRVAVDVSAETIAEDGQRVSATVTFTSADVAGLPPVDKMEAEVRAMAKNLAEQRTAPAVEAGSAAVLFEGVAAAQVARLLLAAPLSGQPVPRSAGETAGDGSMSLADKLGQPVAPKWLTVVDDPTALGPGKRALFGNFDTDDEAVAAERVTLIDHGVVKGLLMSRTPRKEIPRSNGHGRGTWQSIRAGAGSLFVTATGGLGRPQLLAAAVRAAGPKGTVYIVRQLGEASGLGRGQTLQARVAFRYKDGKEGVVRGLSLEGFTPKKLKKDLIAAGKELVVMDDNSSGLPISVVTPALLFEEVDIGKPNDKNRKPPLYPSPLASMPR
jgi:predicted Zn-dependent protease